MQGMCKLDIVELPEYKLPQKPSVGDISVALKKESTQIFSRIPAGSKLVAMCIEGQKFSSEKLAERIEDYSLCSSKITFVIGSSHGLDTKVKNKADLRLSMSDMTFPHQLTRLILCEQVYRALSINSGSKYHK